MFLKLLAISGITVLLANFSDVPPKFLVHENLTKASAIVEGVIETSETPHPGLTVAHLRVTKCYRGPLKSGDEISYASFREGDRYSNELLHVKLIVFLRRRASRFVPPDWETAIDLSEFIYTSDLEAQLPKCPGRKH